MLGTKNCGTTKPLSVLRALLCVLCGKKEDLTAKGAMGREGFAACSRPVRPQYNSDAVQPIAKLNIRTAHSELTAKGAMDSLRSLKG